MAKYILRPHYGDMNIVVLGSKVSSIKKAFKKHYENELEYPEDYKESHVKKVKGFLVKDHKTIEEIQKDYKKFDEDYSFEQAN